MMNIKNILSTIVILFITSHFSSAQTSDSLMTEFGEITFEDLVKNRSQVDHTPLEGKINSSIDVAGNKPTVIRKSPAIISVVTDEEIKRSGARDLMEILESIPGVSFSVDVEGVVGIGMRGNWANEGKVLLLFDGQEMNETVYGTLQFGMHYPIQNIKRIEIIRGPGSSYYGGAAEYAVINIISKSAAELNGINVTTELGQTSKTTSRQNYSISAGKKIKDFGFTISNTYSAGVRSDKTYKDVFGNSYDMTKNSNLSMQNVNIGMQYSHLSFRMIYDNYTLDSRDGFEQALTQSYAEQFRSFISELKYEVKLNDKISITPKISYKSNSPYHVNAGSSDDNEEVSELLYETKAKRFKAGIIANWIASDNFNLNFGAETFIDDGKKNPDDLFRNSNTSHVQYTNYALFSQVMTKSKIVNLTAGARFDYNNAFGGAFVPRIGLTKRMDRVNLKLLYGSSFKAPVIENIESSLLGEIKPEKSNVIEMEASYQISSKMFFTVNVFDITSRNTIIYVVDTSSSNTGIPDGYINGPKTGTQGMELEYKYADQWGFANVSYSFYSTANKAVNEIQRDPYDFTSVLGISKHKVSVNTSLNITQNLFLSPSFVFLSPKSAIVEYSNDEYIYEQIPSLLLMNVYLGTTKLFVKNLEAGIGVYNLFNNNNIMAQPYSSGHAPLPSLSTEVGVKMQLHF